MCLDGVIDYGIDRAHFNLLTAPLFYGFSFLVGRWVLGTDVTFIFPDTLNFEAFWEAFTGNMMIFYSLLIGGIVLGVPMAVGAYYLSMFILRKGTPKFPEGDLLPYGIIPKSFESTIGESASGIRHPVSIIQDPGSRISFPSTPGYTLITGASSGLGREMAIECASQGMNVILVALPGRNLDVLGNALEQEYGIRACYYEMDLTQKEAIHAMVEDILGRYRVNFLINNAGTGGTIPFEESSVDYLERIIQLNITAVSMLTRLLLPELKQHPRAWILNVSSMAAFSPFPYKTIYPASKAFIANFSRSLGEELKGTPVKIAVLHPGPILTNPDVMVRIIRQGANGKRGLLPGRELARQAIEGLKKGKRTIVPGMANKLNRLLMTTIPDEILVPFLSRVVQKEIHGMNVAA